MPRKKKDSGLVLVNYASEDDAFYDRFVKKPSETVEDDMEPLPPEEDEYE